MKRLASLVLALSVLSAGLAAPAAFEGKIRMRITSEGKPQEIQYAMKGARLRMEMSDGKKTMASIVDMKALQVLLLMPDEKMYMVMPFRGAMEQAQAAAAESSFEKTADTAVILGYKTTKYLARTKGEKEPVEIWAAEGIGAYFNPDDFGSMAGKRKPAAWELQLREKGFFPLRTVTKDKRGRETRMEVIALDKSSLPDSLFVPPADFKRFEMPGLGGLLKGLTGQQN
jgi:hypothetical protein